MYFSLFHKEKKIELPIELQRLIYQGKLLNNDDIISSYKIESGNVIHLVPMQNTQIQQNEESPISEHSAEQPLNEVVDNLTSIF